MCIRDSSHALRLGRNGSRVILIGGEFKSTTEALVGNEAYISLEKYNFKMCIRDSGYSCVKDLAGADGPGSDGSASDHYL